MKNNQKGFTIVEAIGILLVIAIIGGAAYFVYSRQKGDASPPTSQSQVQTESPQVDSEIKPGPGAEWNTYYNYKLGFSIQVPKQYLTNGACKEVDFSYDEYGDRYSTRKHPVPEEAIVPATVIEDDNDFYIVSEYTYQLYGQEDSEDGFATDCRQLETDLEAIKLSKESAGSADSIKDAPFIIPLEFSVVDNVKSEKDVLEWANEKFGDENTGITVDISTKLNSDGSRNVARGTEKEEFATYFAYKYTMKYFEEEEKIYYIALGHGPTLVKGQDNYYDDEVEKSFKLLD